MRLVVLACLPVLFLRAQTPCANTPAYSACDMVFELSDKAAAAHPMPYRTVELRGEFRSPRHRTLAVPAFWDGGRRMVIRFAPTEAGDWDYRVTSNIAEWDGKTGSFTAAASTAPGFIRPANVHHWAWTERNPEGLYQAHLWMGADELRFGYVDDATFRAAGRCARRPEVQPPARLAHGRRGRRRVHRPGRAQSRSTSAAWTSASATSIRKGITPT